MDGQAHHMTLLLRQQYDEAFSRWMEGVADEDDNALIMSVMCRPKREVRPTDNA